MQSSTVFTTSVRTADGRVLVRVTADALQALDHGTAITDELRIFARHRDHLHAVAMDLCSRCDGPEVTVDAEAIKRFGARLN
jgi:hypothetical protein